MTKIMTVYVAFDRLKNTDLSINNECTVSPKAYKMGGSRTFLEKLMIKLQLMNF